MTPALVAHAVATTTEALRFAGPADETLSHYFRGHRGLGQTERALIAETVFAVLRRMRSLEAAAGSTQPRLLVAAALVRVLGFSGRALAGLFDDELIARLRTARGESLPPAVAAELPDWLWLRLSAEHGEEEGLRLAQALANPAPLDLRVNLARASREDVLARLEADGLEARATPHSPAGIRLAGKPPINRHPLFKEGLVEVQDEGSQLIAWLLAPRRGEMIADYCAGAGGKTLAAAALMRGTGRIYAFDTSPKRLASLAPRAARAGITNVHSVVLAAGQDARVKRLAGKLDRVLVDAPCSGFGTLRRNPELKWRYRPEAVDELVAKQGRILAAASRLVKPGGRLVYATCSLLEAENEAVVAAFGAAHPEFVPVSSEKLLEGQRIALTTGEYLKLFPHRHGTDAFFGAVFERRKA
ncbi:SAM-dependent methyltransferase [Betaproteobacteria bacterium SCGC AG-212-J23]|nr:SAM-dependent methyltransferase [Betaproteobacteria bacterium SCGC AG-212-J23]